jgi:hypothetical protein
MMHSISRLLTKKAKIIVSNSKVLAGIETLMLEEEGDWAFRLKTIMESPTVPENSDVHEDDSSPC